MNRKFRFQRKSSKTDPDAYFISPLLQQDDDTTTMNHKMKFHFPTKQPDNFQVGNQDSGLLQETPTKGINLVHSLLLQQGTSEIMEKNANVAVSFPEIQPEVIVPRISETLNEKKVAIPRPLLSARPTNELLEAPSKPSEGCAKEQNTEIEKPPCEVTEEPKLTNNTTENTRIEKPDLQVKNEPDLVKKELKMIDSESSEESSSSEGEDDEICEVTNINDSVIVVDDSEGENADDKQHPDYNRSFLYEKDILLDDSEVYRMDLNQELDVGLQMKENLVEILKKQIFIGNLPTSIKRVHIIEFFKRYGKIIDLKFIRSKAHNKSICFLTYKDAKSAKNALEANGLLYCGRNFRVASVGRDPVIADLTILVTDLPNDTSTQDLYTSFEVCGPIKSQYLVKENGKLLAYITFELAVSVEYALLLNKFTIRRKQVKIQKYKNQREKQGLSTLIL